MALRTSTRTCLRPLFFSPSTSLTSSSSPAVTSYSSLKQSLLRPLQFNRNRSTQPSTTSTISTRWLSDIKTRIGACITFGLTPAQLGVAGEICRELAADWRELLAGSEGFLTSPERRGLFRQKVVWGEQDAMGHVNNVMYNRYAESGRVEWTLRYAESIDPAHAEFWRNLVTPRGEGLILRGIKTEFKFPMRYPDRISVYHKLSTEPTPGADTFLFDVVILSEKHQRIAARVTEDCAFYDYKRGKKTSFQPFMVDVLRETWRLQELAQRTNSERVHGLLERVRRLELESWDREGAVEDMGSSAGSAASR